VDMIDYLQCWLLLPPPPLLLLLPLPLLSDV
jgi:hypothetical protein